MKKYRVDDIICSFGIFLDEEVEADSQSEAQEMVLNEIIDNIGNYIDIVLERIEDEDYENCAKNQSDSSLYHLAGDSIVVNVLMAIFKELI